jgi:DNA-binding MarR family transcriptional regulator
MSGTPEEDKLAALAEAIREISQAQSRLVQLLKATHGRDRYSSPGRIILTAIAEHGPRTSADMMREMGVSRQNVTLNFDMLKKAGLIVPAGKPKPLQPTPHAITQAGLDHLAALEAAERPILAELAAALDADDLRNTAALLRTLRSAVSHIAVGVYGERVRARRRWAAAKNRSRGGKASPLPPPPDRPDQRR